MDGFFDNSAPATPDSNVGTQASAFLHTTIPSVSSTLRMARSNFTVKSRVPPLQPALIKPIPVTKLLTLRLATLTMVTVALPPPLAAATAAASPLQVASLPVAATGAALLPQAASLLASASLSHLTTAKIQHPRIMSQKHRIPEQNK